MSARDDIALRDALERTFLGILQGNDKGHGLFWNLRTAPSWDAHQRTVGQIEGIEMALNAMNTLVRAMNGDEEPVRDQYDRSMN